MGRSWQVNPTLRTELPAKPPSRWILPSTPGKEKSGAAEPTVKIGWAVCPQVAKASSKEKINRHIRFRPPFSYPRKSSLYVDDVTNLLRTFIPGAADTAPSLIPS